MRSTIVALMLLWPLMHLDQAHAAPIPTKAEIVSVQALVSPKKKAEKKKKPLKQPAKKIVQKPKVIPRPPVAPTTRTVKVQGLQGSRGYAIPYGNCVLEIGNRPTGNPISWPATTQTPYIGAAALFHYNHVGRVAGIWPNGDIEIAHQNFKGGITRFPRNYFRGFR